MSTRPQAVVRSTQLDGLMHDASRRGLDIMDGLLRQTRDALQQQIDQTRDLLTRDARSRVVSALAQSAPEMRARFPEVLQRAFERELSDNPVTTTLESGPVSIKFEQLELMDEQDVQVRISAARGLQQALQDAEQELTELNTLVSAILGFDQVRPERNPFRPEIYLEALQSLISEMQCDSAAQTQCRQIMVPLLGKSLRPAYQALLLALKGQKVQPVGYVIQRTASYGVAHGPGPQASPPAPPGLATGPAAGQPRNGEDGLAHQVYAGQLTVQQLHGLVSGTTADADQLVQEVVQLILASITGDERLLPPIRNLISGLKPALLQLARSDLHFFSDKQHPARQLLEELAQHSFAFDRIEAEGFGEFLSEMRQALAHLTPSTGAPETFERVLVRLRQRWSQAEKRRHVQQQAAVQALQQAEKRNELARQIAGHIRKQAGTVLVPDQVVDFACGPWAQVMAQAQIDGKVEQPGEPDHVALLEDLFWSVRPDQVRQQPGQLVKIIPQLVKGLRQGLEGIHYPPDQLQHFLDHLFALHQGGLDGASAARSLKPEAQPAAARPWLAPEEARDSGFMDDLGAEDTPDFASTVPAEFPSEFAATEPMGLLDREHETGQVPLESAAPVPVLALDHLQPDSWVELLVSGHWTRLQLVWLSDNASLCLFSSAGGSNHSMTRRMFDRLVAQEHLRRVALEGPVVERAFDAVAELAMRNSVFMAIQAN